LKYLPESLNNQSKLAKYTKLDLTEIEGLQKPSDRELLNEYDDKYIPFFYDIKLNFFCMHSKNMQAMIACYFLSAAPTDFPRRGICIVSS